MSAMNLQDFRDYLESRYRQVVRTIAERNLAKLREAGSPWSEESYRIMISRESLYRELIDIIERGEFPVDYMTETQR